MEKELKIRLYYDLHKMFPRETNENINKIYSEVMKEWEQREKRWQRYEKQREERETVRNFTKSIKKEAKAMPSPF